MDLQVVVKYARARPDTQELDRIKSSVYDSFPRAHVKLQPQFHSNPYFIEVHAEDQIVHCHKEFTTVHENDKLDQLLMTIAISKFRKHFDLITTNS